MKSLLLLVLVLLPSTVFADPGNGIDLSWNDCVGGLTGTAAHNKNFVCGGGVDQTYDLILQFKVDQPFTAAIAWTASLAFSDETCDLGDPVTGFWWLEQPCPGNGRRGLVVMNVPPPSCTDAGILDVSNEGTTGLVAFGWDSNNPTPGHARLIAAYARDAITLDAGANYYLMHFRFNNHNRTACPDGCSDPATLSWSYLYIESTDRPGEFIDGYDKFADWGGINGGVPTSDERCDPTSVKGGTTWGRLKAQYR